MKKSTFNKNLGFTLIELMVVISIFSLLSSIVLIATSSARRSADKSAFIQSMKQFQNALELYRAKYGRYPYEKGATIDGDQPFIDNNNLGSPNDHFTSYFQTISPNGTYEGTIMPSLLRSTPMPLKNLSSIKGARAQMRYYTDNVYGLSGTYCGTTPAKGYLLEYNLNVGSDTIGLPVENYDGNPTTGVAYQWCVTAP